MKSEIDLLESLMIKESANSKTEGIFYLVLL